MRLKVGTRPSLLALKQVEEIRGKLRGVELQPVIIHTKGDKDKVTSLTLLEKTDFFTYEIEQALLKGEVDVAVHSAKDLEENIPEELVIAAVTSSIRRCDCLVSHEGYTFDTLPEKAIVGTSSASRKEGVTRYRNDLIVKDIRGDIDERLGQLDRGDFDAVIMAHAALVRLGYHERKSRIIPFTLIEPHPLQGSLAVQVNKKRKDLRIIFGKIDGK
ncbi:MAG: hydroxymethylbilane synthase [Candidatus Omnitrophota bacterium]